MENKYNGILMPEAREINNLKPLYMNEKKILKTNVYSKYKMISMSTCLKNAVKQFKNTNSSKL